MRINARDETLQRNYLIKFEFLVHEYEKVKANKHELFKQTGEFYKHHNISKQVFLKIYGRYKASGDKSAFLPGKRGPKYTTRRTLLEIEQKVIQYRALGCNKYEIHAILKNIMQEKVPSPSCIYNILRRYGLNKKTPKMIEEKRQIIKDMVGELAHIDTHHLCKNIIPSSTKKYYIIGVIDSCSRLAWAEIISDVTSLSVMFATLRSFNNLQNFHNVKFAQVITDNGSEFSSKNPETQQNHPFERMLLEMGVKHSYIKPYRPQTNGKIERFWRTLNDDLLEGTFFNSLEHLQQELLDYLVYYNQLRPHQSLNGLTPSKFAESCQRIM